MPSGSDSPPPPDDFQPPSPEELAAMLPQYDISYLIAAGGMGAVYAGAQRALDRPVAIKVLPPEAARDGESIDRFRTEAKAMARLTHPNIPAVYDFDVSQGYCYLVMEYIDGWNVHQLITQRELTPDLTYSLLSQVCDALQFAHQRGIVHGDIKPSNLLVTQEGVVKLADFGLAQLIDNTNRAAEQFTPMGTPEYAAPELWQPGVVMDHRADLYSLGCVFYEMLTGSPPQGQFQLPSAALKLDPRVDIIIARCMQQSPSLRYQSALEIKKAIDAILQPAVRGAGGTRPGVRIIRPPARRPTGGTRHHSRPKAPSGSPLPWVLLLGAAGVGAFLVLKEKPPLETPPPASQESPATPGTGAASTAPVSPDNSASATRPPVSTTPPSPKTTSAAPTVPEPPPAAAFSPQTSEKLISLRSKYRAEWQANVAGKLTTERDRLAAYYLAALDKLSDESAQANDTRTLLAVRNEKDRFTRTRQAQADSQVSPVEKLAKLQKTLNEALATAAAKVKPAADTIRESCLLDLKQIEARADSADRKTLSELYDKFVSTPDLASLLTQ